MKKTKEELAKKNKVKKQRKLKQEKKTKQEQKEIDLFNKHKNLLMITYYLDCHYCIYQQHLLEVALKLKYKVYNNHLKQELYYTANSLYKGIQELEQCGFLKREKAKLLSGGETSGLTIRLLPKTIKLLNENDYCFKSRNTNLFWHTVLQKGNLLIYMLDKYLRIAEDEDKNTQEILEYISTNIYNSFLGSTDKYYTCLNSIDTLDTEKDREIFNKATYTQINSIKTYNPKSYTSMEYLKIKEENKKVKDDLKMKTFYYLSKNRHIYYICKLNTFYNFAVLNPSENKTEKDFLDDFIYIYTLFDKFLANSDLDNKLKITFFVNSEYMKNRLTDIIYNKTNEDMTKSLIKRMNKSYTFKVRLEFIVFNPIEKFGQSNIKKENKEIPLSQKYPVKNFNTKIKQIVVKDENDDVDNI